MANLDITESYKQCLTWMMHSWNTCCKVYAECACVADLEGYICMCSWNTESKENTHSCSSRKEVLALYHSFQYHYCYSESDVMCHVTMYCSMIGPHYAVHEDTACVHYTLPFLTSVPSLQDCNRHSPSHCFVESFCPHLLSYVLPRWSSAHEAHSDHTHVQHSKDGGSF